MHLLSADAPPLPGGPWWLPIALAAIAVVGVLGTAFGPSLQEWIKSGRSSPAAADTASTPKAVTKAGDGAVDLVQQYIDDLRGERDEWQAKFAAKDHELIEERRARAQDAVDTAKLQARLDAMTEDRNRLVDRLGRGPQ